MIPGKLITRLIVAGKTCSLVSSAAWHDDRLFGNVRTIGIAEFADLSAFTRGKIDVRNRRRSPPAGCKKIRVSCSNWVWRGQTETGAYYQNDNVISVGRIWFSTGLNRSVCVSVFMTRTKPLIPKNIWFWKTTETLIAYLAWLKRTSINRLIISVNIVSNINFFS